ncbi:MAG: dTDP-4-dehydrorhamnose reductase [bacterium]|nr:dTDP-4-dehydrorhamnose reductase [Candidatus Limimorpha caballi]MCQ2316955.1 dTDP-4-dehydrorhamnose reductase [Bacteroidales bacterium]
MKILVTGCNGQLGTEFRKIAANGDSNVWIFTDVAELDICDEAAVNECFAKNDIDICINCAAYTAVDKAEDNYDMARRLNAIAVKILADTCKRQDALFIHISTDYVFRGDGNEPHIETEPVAPLSVYGKTKAEGEQFIRESGCSHVIIRTSWLYSSVGNNFVKTMLRLGSERETVTVVSDQTGSPTWALDLAHFIMLILNKNGKNEIHETFHFSDEGIVSWCDFANAVFELGGKNCKALPITTEQYGAKAHRPAYSAFNKTKIKDFTGEDIPFWKDSLMKCLEELNKINNN